MKADLHVHTTASDGRLSPAEVIREAAQAGLSHIAITDHDTVDGILELGSTPLIAGLNLIPGIEFSTDLPYNEVHILGFNIDIANRELRRELKLIAQDRLERAERMVFKLTKLGYPVEYDRVLALAGDAAAVGRPHVAAALMERGYFGDMEEVFDTLLEKNKPAYVPHYKLTPQDTINLIKAAGGVPVLAHPGLVGDDAIVLESIKLGLQGMEVFHPKHNADQTAKYREMAEAHYLALTGGSDFHGIPGRFPERLGIFTVPANLATCLYSLSRHESPAPGI